MDDRWRLVKLKHQQYFFWGLSLTNVQQSYRLIRRFELNIQDMVIHVILERPI